MDNSFSGLRFPETVYLENNPQNNDTFHVYDVIRNIGPADGLNTLSYVRDTLLRGAYSYPGYQMEPVSNAMKGGDRLVYVTDPSTKSLEDHNPYRYPVGIIEQAEVPNGIMNITTTEHGVYKGTIRRTAFEYGGNIFVHTHGIGINKAFNLPESGLTSSGFSYAARANDEAGAKAFRELDERIFQAAAARRGGKY